MKVDFDEEELQALYLRCNGYLPEPNAALRRAVAKLYSAQQNMHPTGGSLPPSEHFSTPEGMPTPKVNLVPPTSG